MKITEEILMESKFIREKLIEKTYVLDKVKKLIFLPKTELMTIQQVADFYEVHVDAIEWHVRNNKDELFSDGMEVLKGKRLSELKAESGLKTRAGSLTVFTRRAILRIGMLLRDSEVAKKVRDYLLDVEEESTHRKFIQFCQDYGLDIKIEQTTLGFYYHAKQLLMALGYAGNTTQMLRDFFTPDEKKLINRTWYISEAGLRRLCNGFKRKKMVAILAKYLGIETFRSPVETDIVYAIQEAFKDYKITPQKKIPNSKEAIDIYFEDIKLAVEIDEDGHKSYDLENEAKRQKMFEDYLGCKFLRVNPHQPDYTVGQTIFEIRRYIGEINNQKSKNA